MFHYGYECDVADTSVTVVNATGRCENSRNDLKNFLGSDRRPPKRTDRSALRADQGVSDYLQSKIISPSADQVSKDFQTFKDRLNRAIEFLDEVDEVIETAAQAAEDFKDLIEREISEKNELDSQREARENMNESVRYRLITV